jgi:hypothetical protein
MSSILSERSYASLFPYISKTKSQNRQSVNESNYSNISERVFRVKNVEIGSLGPILLCCKSTQVMANFKAKENC